ncbi:MAG: spore maturation protein [Pseudomonadales bacterium]|nr:spore maturation protein [Pseudomonadales bacterium]MCP5215920.1 spore maturation protein [Pseudomonadales bacterium]
MLSHIWFGFFLLAFIASLLQWLLMGQAHIFSDVITATFDMAKLGVEISLGLIGVLCLWLGFFKVAEASGMIAKVAKLLAPLFRRLMPEIPQGHPALGSVTMNLGANVLGLDNAATPLGLKAMRDLQSLNTSKDSASDAQILFLVLNTSSVTLLPVTVFLFRAQQGAAEPALVFIPILLATTASTLAGLLLTASIQKLPIWDRVVWAYIAGFILLLSMLVFTLAQMPPEAMAPFSTQLGNFILFAVIMLFLVHGYYRRVNVYEAFIVGAKQGFGVAVRIIPYLVGMLVAIGVFRASGVLDGLIWIIERLVVGLGLDAEFVKALPTALMKPLSGSGARAMMLETMSTYGVDSFPALVSATIQGSTETTFYVLAVYFGSVGIKKVRHAIACGLFADLVGIITAILVSYWFFG